MATIQVFLSLMGMTVIGLSMFGSFGLCFYFGFFYTDMTPIVPFLLLGLGVDNMFVMVQVNTTLHSMKKMNSQQICQMELQHHYAVPREPVRVSEAAAGERKGRLRHEARGRLHHGHLRHGLGSLPHRIHFSNQIMSWIDGRVS